MLVVFHDAFQTGLPNWKNCHPCFSLFSGYFDHPLTSSADGRLAGPGLCLCHTYLALFQGVLDGYQTMDALAALNFRRGITLAEPSGGGITEESAVRRGTIRAGVHRGRDAAGGLRHADPHRGISGTAFPGSDTGAAVLTALADGLFGRVGQVLLAAIFVIACFNTCVGLIASVGEYFHELLPQLPYPAIAAFFALVSMLLANIGLADILSLSVPVLNAIYPSPSSSSWWSSCPDGSSGHRSGG